MKFLDYLLEGAEKKNTVMLVLQKIIDMVDDGHVDYSEDEISINIGKLIKDKKYYDFKIIIQKGTPHNVRLAQTTDDGKYVIVIDAPRLPAREKIDTFLSKTATVSKFIPAFQKYLDKYHKVDDTVEASTSYEKGKQVNTRSNFEKKYKELNASIKSKLEDYEKAKADIEDEMEDTGLSGRREVLKLSLDTLKKEYLGSNAKEFVSKMLKLADEDFVTHLDKELKNKLTTRLTDFYEHELS